MLRLMLVLHTARRTEPTARALLPDSSSLRVDRAGPIMFDHHDRACPASACHSPMRHISIFLFVLPVYAPMTCAQMTGAADRLAQAYQDRLLTESTARLKTDEHISMYETLVKAQPEVLHYQNLLAGAYIQKVRESMDYSYLERASQILNGVL